MYYVYFLKSLKNNYLYIGSTKDVIKRFARHNAGQVISTSSYRPWVLLDKEVYVSRSEVVRRERFLKTGQQKELLKRNFELL